MNRRADAQPGGYCAGAGLGLGLGDAEFSSVNASPSVAATNWANAVESLGDPV